LFDGGEGVWEGEDCDLVRGEEGCLSGDGIRNDAFPIPPLGGTVVSDEAGDPLL